MTTAANRDQYVKELSFLKKKKTLLKLTDPYTSTIYEHRHSE